MTSSRPDDSRTRIVSKLRADQSDYWERGERVLVEQLITPYPDLAKNSEHLLELIRSEIQHRLRVGEQPSFEEYQSRFGELADHLRDCWPEATSSDPTSAYESGRGHRTVAQDSTNPSSGKAVVQALPGFELHHRLGQGGMGVVYHARDIRLDQPRAIKFIRTGPLADQETYDRFEREAKAVARLDHANVVRIYSVGEHANTLYICMEYVDGGSLYARLRDGHLEIQAAAELVRQLALGVQHAHENNVLHRDLKPGNVLLNSHGSAKVSDFGLAKLMDENDELTQTGMVMGTAAYMAPEQVQARLDNVREPADIWALGVILYECLTGKVPFKGVNRTETMELVKRREPKPLRELRAEVPADLEAVCLKCLCKKPEDRYASAGALADDLGSWLAGKKVSAPKPPNPQRRWAIGFAGLVVMVGLAIGIYVAAARRDPPPAPPVVPVEQPQQPGEWRSLLTKEPIKLRWPDPVGNSRLNLLPNETTGPALSVASQDLALLGLGATKATRYEIEITVPPEPRKIALFFGYQDTVLGKAPNGLPAHRCQLIEFTTVPVAKGQNFRVDWIDAHFLANSNLRKFSVVKATSEPLDLKPQPHKVHLAIWPTGPAVSIDGKAAPLRPTGDPAMPPEAFQGQFGISLHTTTGVFSDARFLFHKEPK